MDPSPPVPPSDVLAALRPKDRAELRALLKDVPNNMKKAHGSESAPERGLHPVALLQKQADCAIGCRENIVRCMQEERQRLLFRASSYKGGVSVAAATEEGADQKGGETFGSQMEDMVFQTKFQSLAGRCESACGKRLVGSRGG